MHRARSGQPRQRTPNETLPLGVSVLVCPAGQVTVPAVKSIANSSAVNPPGTGARSGIGLMTAVCPAAASAARASPVP